MPTYWSRATAKQVEMNRKNTRRSTGPAGDPEYEGGGAFERLQVYEQRIERQFHDCLQPLRLLRKMRTEHGNDPFADRSAGLGFEASEPHTHVNAHEAASGAPTSSPGVPPVDPSLHSFDLSVQTNDEEREEKTGETPELRRAEGVDRGTGGTPWPLSARAAGERSFARDDTREVVDGSPFDSSKNAGERTKPILLQAVCGPVLAIQTVASAGVPAPSGGDATRCDARSQAGGRASRGFRVDSTLFSPLSTLELEP